MKTVKKCCNKNNSTVYSGAPTPSTFTALTVQVAREKFNLTNQIHAQVTRTENEGCQLLPSRGLASPQYFTNIFLAVMSLPLSSLSSYK